MWAGACKVSLWPVLSLYSLPWIPKGKATQQDGPRRALLSAALLCVRAGYTRASSVLWLTIIRVVAGMGSTVYEACQAPHTASSREAAAPWKERLGGAMARGGHSRLGHAGGSAHCSSPVPPSLHWDETTVILTPTPRRQIHAYPVRLIWDAIDGFPPSTVFYFCLLPGDFTLPSLLT